VGKGLLGVKGFQQREGGWAKGLPATRREQFIGGGENLGTGKGVSDESISKVNLVGRM